MWGSSGPGQGEEEQQGQGRLRRLSGEALSLPIIAPSHALSKNNNNKSIPSPRPQFTGVLPTLLSHPGALHHPTSPTSKRSGVPSRTPGHLGCLSLPQLHKAPRLTEVPTYILPILRGDPECPSAPYHPQNPWRCSQDPPEPHLIPKFMGEPLSPTPIIPDTPHYPQALSSASFPSSRKFPQVS